jgi:hypothetical protein
MGKLQHKIAMMPLVLDLSGIVKVHSATKSGMSIKFESNRGRHFWRINPFLNSCDLKLFEKSMETTIEHATIAKIRSMGTSIAC